MQIEYRGGNLFDADERILVQGCNAQGVMGKGLAKQVKETMPEVFAVYRRAYEDREDTSRGMVLGSIVWAKEGDPDRFDQGRIIANAITQDHYRRDPNESVVHADYGAIALVVEELDARRRRLTRRGDRSHVRARAYRGSPRRHHANRLPVDRRGSRRRIVEEDRIDPRSGVRPLHPVVYLNGQKVPAS